LWLNEHFVARQLAAPMQSNRELTLINVNKNRRAFANIMHTAKQIMHIFKRKLILSQRQWRRQTICLISKKKESLDNHPSFAE
jgi:hypothetical protein